MHGKSWRVCLSVGPNYPWIKLWMHSKTKETRMHSNSSRCRWRTLVSSTFISVFWCVLWVPHSFLEYGTGVIGWRETWLSKSMVGWNVVVSSPVGSLYLLMNKFIPLISMRKCTDRYMDLMVYMFIVFMFLLCCWYAHLPQRLLQLRCRIRFNFILLMP